MKGPVAQSLSLDVSLQNAANLTAGAEKAHAIVQRKQTRCSGDWR